jgi:hypothetical protein
VIRPKEKMRKSKIFIDWTRRRLSTFVVVLAKSFLANAKLKKLALALLSTQPVMKEKLKRIAASNGLLSNPLTNMTHSDANDRDAVAIAKVPNISRSAANVLASLKDAVDQ